MFHIEDKNVRSLLFEGYFGLEKENLRTTAQGYMAHSSHPFYDHQHIVRDFCENQIEINTPIKTSLSDAVKSLWAYTKEIQNVLNQLSEVEYLWPFSNPPYIRNEEDIKIAQFGGIDTKKTLYREYLSDRYGRYKMTFSGIHFNFSFSDELLKADFHLSDQKDFLEYKNELYVQLAEGMAAYGWILVALTAASPLLDSSFVEKGVYGRNTFNGMASTRCSELGYWNYFTPIFNYHDIHAYADSIQKYVDDGLLSAPSELYYPIRLKSCGENSLERLQSNGVDHIELRMLDLNPFEKSGIQIKDLQFAQLLLIWLASTPRHILTLKDQVQAVQNFKNAAHYDLKTVKIVLPDGDVYSVADAGRKVIKLMRAFYQDFNQDIHNILDFEEEKFIDPYKRYAWQIRKLYADGFVEKGLQLAKERQKEITDV